jgi:C_GCAxxG_C_C family probable redox protein
MMLAVGGHVVGDLDPSIVRMTTGFAGGVGGSKQEMCGALSSGVMIIGGLCGREGPEEDDRPALELVTRYRERFAEEFGLTQCAPLRKRVQEPGGLGSCSVVVE